MARSLSGTGDAAIVLFLCFAGMMAVAVLFAGRSAQAAAEPPAPIPDGLFETQGQGVD